MTIRDAVWRTLDRLTAFLPSPPGQRSDPPITPNPDDPGLDPETRLARWRLWRRRYEKQGKGGFR